MDAMALSLPHFECLAVNSVSAFYSSPPSTPKQISAGIARIKGSTTISNAQFAPMFGQPTTAVSEHLLDSASFKAVSAANQKAIADLASNWRQQLLDQHAELSANALTKTVKPVFKALSLFGAGAVDLRGLSSDTVNGVHLAVVLRATLTKKAQTPGWGEALEIARAALHRDGIDETDALAGLI